MRACYALQLARCVRMNLRSFSDDEKLPQDRPCWSINKYQWCVLLETMYRVALTIRSARQFETKRFQILYIRLMMLWAKEISVSEQTTDQEPFARVGGIVVQIFVHVYLCTWGARRTLSKELVRALNACRILADARILDLVRRIVQADSHNFARTSAIVLLALFSSKLAIEIEIEIEIDGSIPLRSHIGLPSLFSLRLSPPCQPFKKEGRKEGTTRGERKQSHFDWIIWAVCTRRVIRESFLIMCQSIGRCIADQSILLSRCYRTCQALCSQKRRRRSFDASMRRSNISTLPLLTRSHSLLHILYVVEHSLCTLRIGRTVKCVCFIVHVTRETWFVPVKRLRSCATISIYSPLLSAPAPRPLRPFCASVWIPTGSRVSVRRDIVLGVKSRKAID